MTEKRFLFISHDASRSGAPFVLLYLLQWIKKNSSCELDVLLLEGGPLKGDFEKVADRIYLVDELLNEHPLKGRIRRKLRIEESPDKIFRQVDKHINISSYNLIYGNTIVSLSWLVAFKELYGVKVIAAIHEQRISMETFYSVDFLKTNFPKLDMIIAVSQAVAHDLKQQYGVAENIIRVVHEFIPTYSAPPRNDGLLQTLGIPANRFIIGGVGNTEWRKGFDLLVHLAIYFKKHFPDFDYHFLWVGGHHHTSIVKNLIADIDKAAVGDRITLVESTSKSLEYMQYFHLFAMLSREDPFPLVSLEASFLEKPIVMFEGTGGTAELMVNGGGEIVPYLDIEALAEVIVRLAGNDEMRSQMGKILKKEVIEKYNSEVMCRKLIAVLESVSDQK